MTNFDINLKTLENWRGEFNKYYCKLSAVMGGINNLELAFIIIPKNYTPINKYGTHNEPYSRFKINVAHLDKYNSKQVDDLLAKINTIFKTLI